MIEVELWVAPLTTMLLNHKEAIEFMVDAVPEQGITVPVVRNLHGLLMQGLLSDPLAAGAIRRRIVENSEDTITVPHPGSLLYARSWKSHVDRRESVTLSIP